MFIVHEGNYLQALALVSMSPPLLPLLGRPFLYGYPQLLWSPFLKRGNNTYLPLKRQCRRRGGCPYRFWYGFFAGSGAMANSAPTAIEWIQRLFY